MVTGLEPILTITLESTTTTVVSSEILISWILNNSSEILGNPWEVELHELSLRSRGGESMASKGRFKWVDMYLTKACRRDTKVEAISKCFPLNIVMEK